MPLASISQLCWLFRVYSRYVPNLTRRDGSAFERLITQTLGTQLLPVKTPLCQYDLRHLPLII